MNESQVSLQTLVDRLASVQHNLNEIKTHYKQLTEDKNKLVCLISSFLGLEKKRVALIQSENPVLASLIGPSCDQSILFIPLNTLDRVDASALIPEIELKQEGVDLSGELEPFLKIFLTPTHELGVP